MHVGHEHISMGSATPIPRAWGPNVPNFLGHLICA